MAVKRDYECVRCGEVREAVGEPWMGLVCSCGSVMMYIVTLSKAQPATDALWPLWHPHLGHEPTEIRGWGHFKQVLKERNLSNVLGS